jgi:signal transduction histidine kinase
MDRMLRGTKKQPAGPEVFPKILKQATDALDRLRTISRGIFPPLLVDQGLVPALEGHIRKIDSVRVHFEADMNGDRFDRNAEASVFFCCVEGVKDAARRARGKSVTLRLRRDKTWVEFVLAGGRPPIDETLLLELTDRVEALGGRLEASVGDDGASTLIGRVPAHASAEPAHAAASTSGSSSDLDT